MEKELEELKNRIDENNLNIRNQNALISEYKRIKAYTQVEKEEKKLNNALNESKEITDTINEKIKEIEEKLSKNQVADEDEKKELEENLEKLNGLKKYQEQTKPKARKNKEKSVRALNTNPKHENNDEKSDSTLSLEKDPPDNDENDKEDEQEQDDQEKKPESDEQKNEIVAADLKKEIEPNNPDGQIVENSENKALQPLYWQVYNKVATEKCSSPARALYNLSKITVLPWNQDMSTPEKFLSAVGTIYRAPMKLIGYLGTKITGTDKKFAKMKDVVDKLPPEEFSVLIDTPEESAKKFGREVKSRYDQFSLTSDTMRQYKHNTLALDAIGTRFKSETDLTLALIKQQKADGERLYNELKNAIPKATPEQKAKINIALQMCNQKLEDLEKENKKAVEKNDAFFNGLQHRTAKYKDTEGWVLARFNPDNRTANKEMQKLQEKYMEAVKSNDPIAVKNARDAIENFGKSQSKVITVGSNIHNKINRGLYSVDAVKTQNMTPQTIGKQILANVAAVGCVEKFLTDLHNIHIKDEAIQANNARIEEANRYNANIPYSDTVNKQVVVRDHIQNVDQAEQGMKNVNILAAQGMGEHGNLDMSAMETNGSWMGGLNTPAYVGRDNPLHTATANEVANGTVDSSFSLLNNVINKYKPAQEQYAAAHNFDYSFLKAMDLNSINELNNLFKQFNVPINVTFDINGAVTGAEVLAMGDIAYKTMTPALIATLAASQAGYLASAAKEKNKTENEEKKQQKSVEREEMRQQRAAKKEEKKQQKAAEKERKAKEKAEKKQQWKPIVPRTGEPKLNGTTIEENEEDEEIELR